MKALFQDVIVDVIRKSEVGYRIKTNFGEMDVEAYKIIEIPDALFQERSAELENIDNYIQQVRAKLEEIMIRYNNKRVELNQGITQANNKKRAIISEFKEKGLKLK